jgi:beta-lactam-binding protein with PASTA domain
VSDYEPSYIPGQRRPGFGTVVFVSVLTSAAVSVGTVAALMRWGALGLFLGLGTMQTQQPAAEPLAARIPDVVGISAEAADELLTTRKLRLVVHERRAHPTVPAGSVISQSPLAQSRVSPGGEVAVVLSTGPARSQVPDLLGKPIDEAKKELEAAGFRVGPITDSENSTGQASGVTATSPPAGTALDPGTTVALTLARAGVAVPRVLGEHIRAAREQIAKLGLVVGEVSEIYDEHRRGNLVLTQDPQPGTKVALGTKINLVVNQGD